MVLRESKKFAQQRRREGALSSLLFRHFPGPLGLWSVVSLDRSLLRNCEQVPGLPDI